MTYDINSIIPIVLLFVDGLLFGIAAKKAVTSAILIVVGLVLATAVGVTIPFITTADIWTHVFNILRSQASHIGPVFFAMPLFWIVGFGIGLWKG
ncbi:MAG: hypothetical protein JRN15_08920 [Nitrososphaerota archaeon]|jgi:hypothetical protein|nr:hypothetical protein [Nitrososphaerota archaeon]